MPLLRDVGADAKGVATGGFAGCADGETGDFLGSGNVAVEQRGREVADGDVVETVARLVVGEQRGGVDGNAEEIADGVLVFRAVEAAEGVGAAGVGRGGGEAVEGGLEFGDGGDVGGRGWAIFADGRHLAVVELADDFFPERGIAGEVSGILSVEAFEGEVALFRRGVVAVDAVGAEE